MGMALCDATGYVRSGAMWHGTDYQCTGHAHFGGEHIECTNMVGHARSANSPFAVDVPKAPAPAACPGCGSTDVTIDYRVAYPDDVGHYYPAVCQGCGAKLGWPCDEADLAKMVRLKVPV